MQPIEPQRIILWFNQKTNVVICQNCNDIEDVYLLPDKKAVIKHMMDFHDLEYMVGFMAFESNGEKKNWDYKGTHFGTQRKGVEEIMAEFFNRHQDCF